MDGNSLRNEMKDQIINYLTDHIKASEVRLDRLYKISCDLADIAFDITGVNPDAQDKPF